MDSAKDLESGPASAVTIYQSATSRHTPAVECSARLAIQLIGLWLVDASPKEVPLLFGVHNVGNEISKNHVPLREEINASLIRQGILNVRGFGKWIGKKKEKGMDGSF